MAQVRRAPPSGGRAGREDAAVLTALGLTERSDTLYRTMLLNPGLGVRDLAARLGWPEGDVRAALDELADLALLHTSRTDDSPRVIDPQVAFNSLMARQQAKVAEQQRALAASRAAAEEFVARYTTLLPEEPCREGERIRGAAGVLRRLAELGEHVEREVLCFTPGGAQSAESIAAGERIFGPQLARGVRLRTVLLDSVRNDSATLAHARWQVAHGGEVRTVPSLPLRMQIMDDKAALVPLDPEGSAEGAALLREPGALAALRALFENVWATAVPLGTPPRRSIDDPGSQPRELLRLLAQGYTDEAAARRLGVSLRTERRLISDLMTRLGAQSRFQLGQRAMEHGLL